MANIPNKTADGRTRLRAKIQTGVAVRSGFRHPSEFRPTLRPRVFPTPKFDRTRDGYDD